MKNLTSFLTETNTPQADLARRLGISRSHLSLIVSGDRKPSLDLAFVIERETGGAVPAKSFVTDEADGDASPPAQAHTPALAHPPLPDAAR